MPDQNAMAAPAASGVPGWDEEFDVIVIGSGSAGLSAALTAGVGGLRTLLLEKAPVIGGTSAMSGSGTWIPANHRMLAAGHADSPEEAMTYIRAASPPGWEAVEAPRWQAFAETAPRMLRFVEAHTPLRFSLINHPDVYAELPGGKVMGRMLEPNMLSFGTAGPWRRHIRRSTKPQVFRYEEIMTGDALVHPVRTVMKLWPRLLMRLLRNRRGMGNALVIGMTRGCIDAGVQIRLNAQARSLVTEGAGGRVTGLEAEIDGKPCRVAARKGIVIASGGFEWDDAMLREHFYSSELMLRASPSTNAGDGHKMAAAVGADFDRMGEANINTVATTDYEGRRHGMPLAHLDYPPHSMIVNRDGRRFMNEGARNIGLVLNERDPSTKEPLHLPAWRVFDSRYARNQAFFMRLYDRKPPDHLRKADSIAALAAMIGVPPQALQEAVDRFNGFARKGVDEDFHRGETGFEMFYTEDGKRENRNGALGTIEAPPFYANPYFVGMLGTKGGPRTNERAQVLRQDGSVIGGLYCAGVAMANPFGTKNIGAGTTIGPNLTWGHIAGTNLLLENA